MAGYFAPGTSLPTGNRFAAIGDSVIAGTGTGTTVDNTTGDFGLGWFEHACISSNGRMRRIYNAGVPGNTTTQMLARISTITALAGQCDWCFLGPSINDVAGAIAQSTTISNLTAMVTSLRAVKIEPVFVTVQPNNTGPGTYHTATLKLNAAVVDYATRNGIVVIDVYGMLVDPSTAGSYASGMSETASPAVHPSKAGHKAIGAAVAAWAATAVRYTPSYLPVTDSDPNNLLPTGTFSAGTSGVPTGWASSGTGTVTLSFATDTTITGRWVQMDRTSTDSTKAIVKTISSGFSVGDKIVFTGLVSTTVEAAVGSVSAYVQFQSGTGGPTFIYTMHGSPYDMTKGRFYGEGVVPTGTTGILAVLQMNTPTSATAAQAKFAQVAVINRTVLGLSA